MRPDREKALKLRLQGKSYTEISRAITIPKSTLSGWLSDITLSEGLKSAIEKRARKRSLVGLMKRNKNQTKFAVIRADQNRHEGLQMIQDISRSELFFLGVALYWAEGYKRTIVYKGKERTYHPISLTNSDPYLIKLFLRFLRENCHVPEEKIKAGLRIFDHQNENMLLRYWHEQTRIPLKNFGKVYHGISRSSMGKRPYNRLQSG